MANDTSWKRLWALADHQYGAFALQQAAELSIPARAIQRLARSEQITRLHKGVYQAPGASFTNLLKASAAILAVPDGALLAGRTAAAVWELVPRFPHVVEVVHRTGSSGGRHKNVHQRRSSTLAIHDRAMKRRLPVTSPARTIADLAQSLEHRQLLDAAARALRSNRVSIEELREVLGRYGRAAGAGSLRRVIKELEVVGRTDSLFERDVRSVLIDDGFKPVPGTFPLRQADELIAVLDIAFPDQRVCIECDGRHWHSLPSDFSADRDRWSRITAAGWSIVYVTYSRFRADSRYFLPQLDAALARAQKDSVL